MSSRLILLELSEVRHAETAAPFRAVGIDVDPDDASPPPTSLRALNDVEPDPAQSEHDDSVDPGWTFAVFTTAPTPVVTPQPI